MDQVLEQLREQAGLGTACGSLANELLVITDQYQSGQIAKEDFQYLIQQVAEVKTANELANDEIAARFIYEAATTLISAFA